MRRLLGVVLAALVVTVAASAATAADPGVSKTSILIGGTVPLSGEAAAFGAVGPGAKAYFDYVNSRGGVHGRKIEYRFYDDAYNPAQTVQQTRRLVEQDRVFAVFNAIGTANNLAIRDYLNAQKVPHLFAGDGSQALRGGSARYPWTVGFLPSYQGEGSVVGRDLVRTKPRATVGVLYENTELGKDMTRGLSRALAGKGPRIVASEAYELTSTDVVSQIAKLKSSGADTLMLFATPKFMIQGIVAAKKLGWKPQLYLSSVSIEPTIMAIARANAPELTRGARAIAFVKNPNDPVWRKDPAVALYRSILKRFAPGCEADRRVPLVRHERRVDDGRHSVARRDEPHTRERAPGGSEPEHRTGTRSCCRARCSARRRRTPSRSTRSTCIATTTASGSAPRGPSRPDDARSEREREWNAHEEAHTHGRVGVRRACGARADGRRHRGVHHAEAHGDVRQPGTSRASSRRRRTPTTRPRALRSSYRTGAP